MNVKAYLAPLTFGLAAIFVSSCGNSKYPGYKTTDSGLNYKILTSNEKANSAKEGDMLMMEMVYLNEKDSIIYDSRKQGKLVPVPLTKPTFVGGIEEGFAMMHLGDSASFIVSADSLFHKTFGMNELPKSINKGSMLTFFVKLKEIKTKAEIEKMRKERMEKMESEMAVLKDEEQKNLKKYLDDNKITSSPTASGLYYLETTKGTGVQAEKGKKVSVMYVGKLVDGTIFDTNIPEIAKKSNMYNEGRKYEPLEFTIGNAEVIPGWEEGFSLMKSGGKARFIIPSALAYGQMEQGPIKPFSTLIFDVELLKVQ